MAGGVWMSGKNRLANAITLVATMSPRLSSHLRASLSLTDLLWGHGKVVLFHRQAADAYRVSLLAYMVLGLIFGLTLRMGFPCSPNCPLFAGVAC